MAHEYIFDILNNDKTNVTMMENTLLEIKNTLFNNMYNAEKSIVDIHRFDLKMDKYITRTATQCTYSIPLSLIDELSRDTFRRSEFYKKQISINDMVNNPKIFSLFLLVFINGDLYTNMQFKFKPEESITLISFDLYNDFDEFSTPYVKPGFTQVEMEEFIKNKSQMTIVALPNYQMEKYDTTKNHLNQQTMGNTNLGINIIDFTSVNNIIVDDDKYAVFFTKNDEYLYRYTYADVTNTDTTLYFNPNEVSKLTNSYTYLMFMKFRNVLDIITVSNDTPYFTIEQQEFPIPVENMIIFRKTSSGIQFDHESSIEMYYPNIYKLVKSHNDDMIIWVFYKDDTTYGSKHTDELRLYNRYVSNVIDKYNDDTIPEIIKKYKPISTTYGIEGFKSQVKDALHYKIDTLKDLIRKDNDLYRIYLNKLISHAPEMYIDVSDIKNLQSRYRVDTSNEYNYNVITFEEPCYVFIFNVSSENVSHILTIDSKTFVPKYTIKQNNLLYVYIPVSMVNADSMIYIKMYYDSYFTQKVTPTNTNTLIPLDVPNANDISALDMFITKDGKYVDPESYEFYTLDSEGNYVLINEYNAFYHYDNFYVKVKDNSLVNTEIQINSNKINKLQTQYLNYRFQLFHVNGYIANDVNNFRLFKNGQLVPRLGYSFRFNENAGGRHIIRGLTSIHNGDIFSLSYTSDKYFLVYTEKLIDEHGIINVYGKLNKPIDLRWYHIYVNGLAITEDNIEIIAPYLFVIKNIPTRKNLEIYQVNLDHGDSVEIDTENDDISNKIYDNIEEIKNNLKASLTPLSDDLPDMYDDIFKDYAGLVEDILWYWLNYINPDVQQITDTMVEYYGDILDHNNNYFMNPDDTIDAGCNIYINPDNIDWMYMPVIS